MMEEPAILMVRSGHIFHFIMTMITSPSSIMSSSAESDTWPSIGMSIPTSAPRPKPDEPRPRAEALCPL